MDDETVAYGCEVLFSAERAQAVQRLVEESTGKPCPCKVGRACPLLPRRSDVAPAEAPAA